MNLGCYSNHGVHESPEPAIAILYERLQLIVEPSPKLDKIKVKLKPPFALFQ